MPALILIHEGAKAQIYPLGKETLLIGREKDSDISLPSEYISSSHASIILENGEFVLHDDASANGSYVNGELVKQCVLKHLDLIRFGTYLFQVNFKEINQVESQDVFIEPLGATGSSEKGLLLKVSKPLSREEYDKDLRQWLKQSE
jgi:pSer/pThr/pTyr-binding forkhead associated (FHA) protein